MDNDSYVSKEAREKVIKTLQQTIKDRPLLSPRFQNDPRQLEAAIFQWSPNKEEYFRRVNKILQLAGFQQSQQQTSLLITGGTNANKVNAGCASQRLSGPSGVNSAESEKGAEIQIFDWPPPLKRSKPNNEDCKPTIKQEPYDFEQNIASSTNEGAAENVKGRISSLVADRPMKVDNTATAASSNSIPGDGSDDAAVSKLRRLMYHILPADFKYTKAEIGSMSKERLLEIDVTEFLQKYDASLEKLINSGRQKAEASAQKTVESAQKEKTKRRRKE